MTEGAASRYAVAVDADVQTEDPAQGVQVTAGETAPARPGAGLVRWAPLVVALPGLVAALSVLVQGWVPTTDQAVQMLRIDDVGTNHTPLVGAWSRYGWNHPGPLLYWVAAPGYRLLGTTGVAVTVGLVHAAAAAGAVVAARRIGGELLAWLIAAAVGIVSLSLGDLLVDPWNPYVGIVALLAYFLCAWGAAKGDGWLLLAAVVAGAWCVQGHFGYVPVVVTAAVWSAVTYLIRRRRGGRRLGGRFAVGAVLLALACWSGPLVDEIRHEEGNLRELAAYAREGPDGMVGWEVALDQAGRSFGVPAPWLGAGSGLVGLLHPAEPALALKALALVAATAVAAVVAFRRGRRERTYLAGYAVGLVAVSTYAMSRSPGPVLSYMLVWTWAVAALLWVAFLWAAAAALRGTRSRHAVTVGVAVLAVAVTAAATVGSATAEGPASREGRTVEALSAGVRPELEDGTTYRLYGVDPGGFALVGTGLVSDLRRRGYDVRMPRSMTSFEPRERVGDRDVVPSLTVLTVDGTVPTDRPPDARLLDADDPLTGAERGELEALAAAVRTAAGLACDDPLDLRDPDAVDRIVADGADRDDAARVAALQQTGPRTEVWLSPPSPAELHAAPRCDGAPVASP
jgi:uncharacterized membrane protein